jgi:hypothetical protein
MRLLEFELSKQDMQVKRKNKQLIDIVLAENYGHAGLIYTDYLVRNQTRAAKAVNDIQTELSNELNAEQPERFWVSAVAANLTGGFIAGDKLGLLIGWDLKRIRDWALNQFTGMRQNRALSATTPEGVLGAYMNLYYNNIVTINGRASSSTTHALKQMIETRGEIVGRFEPDTNELFIARKSFAAYCSKNNADDEATIAALQKSGVVKDPNTQKRMTVGTSLATPNVRALKIDYTHSMFAGLPSIPNAAKP